MLIGNMILVLSETGELALGRGDAGASTANWPACRRSMTRTSPGTIRRSRRRILLVRNAREAACYRLPLKQ